MPVSPAALPPPSSSRNPVCGADWQYSAARLGGALPYIGGTWVKSAVVLMLLSAELFFFFFSSLWALDEVHCYVSVTCLSSVKALLSAAPRNSERCWGWNVRCSLEGLAHRGKVMARTSLEKKVPQLILSVKKSRTGDTYASLGRTTPERDNRNLGSSVKLDWKKQNKTHTHRSVSRTEGDFRYRLLFST